MAKSAHRVQPDKNQRVGLICLLSFAMKMCDVPGTNALYIQAGVFLQGKRLCQVLLLGSYLVSSLSSAILMVFSLWMQDCFLINRSGSKYRLMFVILSPVALVMRKTRGKVG